MSRHGATLEERREKRRRFKERKRRVLDNRRRQGCIHCGSLENLTFHHRNPSEKVIEISSIYSANYSFGKFLREVDKCDVICRGCHDIIHNMVPKNKILDSSQQFLK